MNSENKQTFGQHFANIPIAYGGINEVVAIITDGEFPTSKIIEYFHWHLLLGCYDDVLKEFSNVEFINRASLALLMDMAMKRMYRIHGYNAPRPWIPIMNTLRLGGPPMYRPGEEQRTYEERLGRWEKYMPIEVRGKNPQVRTKKSMVAWRRGSQFLVACAREAEIIVGPPYEEPLVEAPPLATYGEAWRYLDQIPNLVGSLKSLRNWLWENDSARNKENPGTLCQ